MYVLRGLPWWEVAVFLPGFQSFPGLKALLLERVFFMGLKAHASSVVLLISKRNGNLQVHEWMAEGIGTFSFTNGGVEGAGAFRLLNRWAKRKGLQPRVFRVCCGRAICATGNAHLSRHLSDGRASLTFSGDRDGGTLS
jgi:hypothetical protein